MTKISKWEDAVKNVAHYLAVGQKEIYLFDPPYPWHLATSISSGGSHRLDMDTSICFRGTHDCGLSFRWHFEVERESANGTGYYDIDVDGLRAVLSALPDPAILYKYLLTCANAVAKKAEEWEQIAQKEQQDADILRQLVKGG